MSNRQRVQVAQLRHGESIGNKASERGVFGGGHPDDVPGRGPVLLSPNGERQATAAGIVADKIDLAIDHVVPSKMQRARDTADLVMDSYSDNPQHHEPLEGFEEINHGLLERTPEPVSKEYAEARKALCTAAMRQVLAAGGLHERYADHIGWVQPNGDGSGQTYLEAALQAAAVLDGHQAVPLNNVLYVGHNGKMRQGRAYTSTLNSRQRQAFASEFAATLATPLAEIREAITLAYYGGEELSQDRLVQIFSLGGTAMKTIIEQLAELGMPKVSGPASINAKSKRLGNAGIVRATIQPDGLWVIHDRITPILPPDPQAPIDHDTVGYRHEPFRSAATWV